MIILVGGEKGGTGKTTVATNLAQIHASAGNDVLLLDMDKQESATAWMERRSENEDIVSPACMAKHSKSQKLAKGSLVSYLLKELRQLTEKYDTIVIDSGGRDSIEFRAALSIANKLYTPIKASQADIDTLAHLNDVLLEEIKISNPDLESFVFINQASTNIRSSRALETRKVLLDDYENLQLSETTISERDSFIHALGMGLGISELKDDKAKREMTKLYNEVFQ